MSSDSAQDVTADNQEKAETVAPTVTAGKVQLTINAPHFKADYATIFGLIVTIGLIAGAIFAGSSDANFINIPALLIVILGTMAATSVAFTTEELEHIPGILGRALIKRVSPPSVVAQQLVSMATIAKTRGILALAAYSDELKKDPFLNEAMQLVIDGYSSNDIEHILGKEVDFLVDRHQHAASIVKRASEIAPAMGLIGTLVGLVQMLSQLDDPAAIGPAMAVALLTTFYGAIMGTVVLSPLSAKLDRNSNDEAMIKGLVMTAAGSIARQENPRRLEMLLNSALSPQDRISYFD